MKKVVFLIKGIVLAIAVILSADYLGQLMATVEKSVNMDTCDDCDVAFIGSSHVYRGINPQQIYDEYGLTGVNLATSSQTVTGSYWMMRAYLKNHHPQAVVVDMFPAPEGAKNAYMLWTMHEYDPLKHFAYADLKNDAFDMNDANRFLAYRTAYDSIDKSDFDFVAGRGHLISDRWFNAVYSKTLVLSEEDVQSAYAQEITYDMDRQLSYAQKMIELAKQKDTKLVFDIGPYMIRQGDLEFFSRLSALAEENGIDYINFNMDGPVAFELATDYSDTGGHLSYEGGLKYTAYLGDYLRNAMGIVHDPDKRISDDWEENREHYQMTYDLINVEPSLDSYLNVLEKLGGDYVQIFTLEQSYYDGLGEEERGGYEALGVEPRFDQGSYYVAVKDGNSITENVDAERAEVYSNIDGVTIHIARDAKGSRIQTGTMENSTDGDRLAVWVKSYNSRMLDYECAQVE